MEVGARQVDKTFAKQHGRISTCLARPVKSKKQEVASKK
jgi:hypothetical protein